MLIKLRNDSHWYTRDGVPCYEVRAKNGRMRKTTLRDARKMQLVPSVTTILKIVANPFLEKWKQSMLVEAALTFPIGNRSVDECVPEIIENADEFASSAAEFGTMVHNWVEKRIKYRKKILPGDPPQFKLLADWLDEAGFSHKMPEVPFANMGFGGKVDLLARDKDGNHVIVDWKTKKTRAGEKIKGYPSWGAQLAAYAHGLEVPNARLLNVVVSSNDPARGVHVIEWTERSEELWDAFQAAFKLWKGPLGKNYDPEV